MDENIKEITEKYEKKLEAEFGAEYKKFVSKGQYEKQISKDKKFELVSRAKKIINSDQLTELANVLELLNEESDVDQQKMYFILIDKLDERWVDTSSRFRLIRSLIESLKSFRRIPDLKILVALRADIIERVVQESQDVSFQREKYESLFVKMKWSKALLLEMVRKRIRLTFRRRYSPTAEVEFEDIFSDRVGNVDPFDYLLERTLMRPRDVIAFVNQCLRESQGVYEVSGSHIRKAEREYSRVRREALEQEWKSTFPTLRQLLDFVAMPRVDSYGIESLLAGSAVEKLALDLAASQSVDFDPIHSAASLYIEKGGDQGSFVREVLAVLYRVGAIGLKLRPTERMSYSHLDEPVVDAGSVPDNVRIRIHPMLHASLRLVPGRGQQWRGLEE